MCSNADPRAALAEYIRQKTDNGNQVVDYLHDVLRKKLDGVKHGHRVRAAHILTHYGDLAAIRFLEKNKEDNKAARNSRKRQNSQFDDALAQVIRDKTNDTQDVADYLINTMNGIDSTIESGLGKIRHQHRIAAALELLRRGIDCETSPAAPEPRPEHAGVTENPQPNTEDEPADCLAIVKRVVESMPPSEDEEEAPAARKTDLSMWDTILAQPEPEISDEHARIGAALFHEAVERDRLWKRANDVSPTRKEHDNYDDG